MNKPKNIPTWNYSSPGTPIFRDTTALPFALGGQMDQLTEFNEGGSHEENPLNGIPQGTNPQGQMNLVEEGETKLNSKDYIFSDSLKVDKETAEAFNLPSFANGKTFADVSKGINSKNDFRKNDTIDNNHKTKLLDGLMEAQEAYKMKQVMIKMQELQSLMPQGMDMGQFMQPQGDMQQIPQEQPIDSSMEQPMEGQEQMPQEMPTIEQMRRGGKMYPEGGQLFGTVNNNPSWANTQDLTGGNLQYQYQGQQPTQYTTDLNQQGSNFGMSTADEGMKPSQLQQGKQRGSQFNIAGGVAGFGAGYANAKQNPDNGEVTNTWEGARGGAAAANPVAGLFHTIGTVGENLQAKVGTAVGLKNAKEMSKATFDPAGSLIKVFENGTKKDKLQAVGAQLLGANLFTGQLNKKINNQKIVEENNANRTFHKMGGYLDFVQFAPGGRLQDGDPPYISSSPQVVTFDNIKRTRSLNDTYDIAIPQGRNSQESIFAYSPEEQNILRQIYEQNPELTDDEVGQLFPQGLKNVTPEVALDIVDNYTESSRLGSNNTNPGEAGGINADTKEKYILPNGSPTIDASLKTDAEGNVIIAGPEHVEAGLATYNANGNIVWKPEQSKKLDDTQGINLEANKVNQAGQLVPVAYNTAMGIGTMFQKPTQLKYEDYMNKSKLNAYKMNINPQLRAVDESSVGARKGWKAGSSGGTYLTGLNNLANQSAMSKAQLYANKENTDNQLQMQADQFNIGLESQNKGQRFQIDDWNARSKAAKQATIDKYLSTAVTQVGQISRANREDQLGMEYARLAGPDVAKGLDSYNPYWFNMKEKKKKDSSTQ